MLSSQMLRPERRDVDDQRGCEEVVPDDRVEEEDQVQNDDVEVVVDEVREVDLLLSKMSKTRSVKSMSMLEAVARCCRPGQKDLVEEEDVEVVVQKILMSHCDCGGWSLLVHRG